VPIAKAVPVLLYFKYMQLIFREDIDRDIANWRASLAMQKNYNYVGEFKGKYFPKDIPLEKADDKEYLRNYPQERFYANGKVLHKKRHFRA
jgi:hypothetical protein